MLALDRLSRALTAVPAEQVTEARLGAQSTSVRRSREVHDNCDRGHSGGVEPPPIRRSGQAADRPAAIHEASSFERSETPPAIRRGAHGAVADK